MIGCLGHSCLSLTVDAIELSLLVDRVSSAACVSSESELELVQVLVAEELGVDSDPGSVEIIVICGLLTAVRCAKMWS